MPGITSATQDPTRPGGLCGKARATYSRTFTGDKVTAAAGRTPRGARTHHKDTRLAGIVVQSIRICRFRDSALAASPATDAPWGDAGGPTLPTSSKLETKAWQLSRYV